MEYKLQYKCVKFTNCQMKWCQSNFVTTKIKIYWLHIILQLFMVILSEFFAVANFDFFVLWLHIILQLFMVILSEFSYFELWKLQDLDHFIIQLGQFCALPKLPLKITKQWPRIVENLWSNELWVFFKIYWLHFISQLWFLIFVCHFVLWKKVIEKTFIFASQNILWKKVIKKTLIFDGQNFLWKKVVKRIT
jgi:hypothetical protein